MSSEPLRFKLQGLYSTLVSLDNEWKVIYNNHVETRQQYIKFVLDDKITVDEEVKNNIKEQMSDVQNKLDNHIKITSNLWIEIRKLHNEISRIENEEYYELKYKILFRNSLD
jgi:hypothetical protein